MESGLGVDHCFASKPKEMWTLPSWLEKGELQEQISIEKNQSPCFVYRTNTEQAVRVSLHLVRKLCKECPEPCTQ